MNRKETVLVGNPNAGKTSVFNLLTGLNQKVGNWPGVTVEKKEGLMEIGDTGIHIVDLPGIYDLHSFSADEQVTENYLLYEKPECVIYIADATKLTRSLYLALEIMEMNIPMIFCLNMTDMAEKKGLAIDSQKLADILNIPVVLTNARQNKGIEELKKILLQGNFSAPQISLQYSDDLLDHGIEASLEKIALLFEQQGLADKKRYWALKILENLQFLEEINLPVPIKNEILLIRENLDVQHHHGLENLIVEKRYAHAHGISKEVSRERFLLEQKLDLSDKIDRILTHKFLGIPIFLGVIWTVFQAVFKIGTPLSEGLIELKTLLSTWIAASFTPNLLTSFVSDALIQGVGSVVVLLPNILILFFFMAILEDSGYMARAAFVMDSFMHRFGLHGKSFIPMILGFGCNVPAIMASRTIETQKDRVVTILISPFISCSARLPIYVLFAGVFFKGHEGWVVFSLYMIGILVAILSANLFKKMFFKEASMPLIIELPFYQVPSAKKLLIHMWERSRIYLRKAGTIIFFGSIIIWFLGSMPYGVEYASEKSWIGKIGQFAAPIFAPAGFGFWQAALALISGIMAKETVVSTMATLFAGYGALDKALPQMFSPLSAYAFLIMSLLYVPCVATIAAMKQEAGLKWSLVGIFYSLFIGWILAVIVFQVGSLF